MVVKNNIYSSGHYLLSLVIRGMLWKGKQQWSKARSIWDEGKRGHQCWVGWCDVSFLPPTHPQKPESIFGKILFVSWAVSVPPLLYYIIQKIKNQRREF